MVGFIRIPDGNKSRLARELIAKVLGGGGGAGLYITLGSGSGWKIEK